MLGSIAAWRKAAGRRDHCHHMPQLDLTGDQWWQMLGFTHKQTPARSKILRIISCCEQLAPVLTRLLSLSRSVFQSLPPTLSHPLTYSHVSAAGDVDRMCVTRDQDGVSAMRAILITSINTYCGFITCLLLEAQMPWTQSILILRSCP